MDNTSKPEEKKKGLGWLWLVVILLGLGVIAWTWYKQRDVNKTMARVRSFREPKDDKPASDV